MPVDGDPESRDELIASLEGVHREADELFRSLPPPELFRRPQEGVWSPAENLVHLVKSVRAVASGLGMPKLALALLFGRSKEGSRSFDEMRTVYRQRLAQGGRAGGRYVPPALEYEDEEAAERTRARILAGWEGAGGALVGKLRSWNEAGLDRYRMPHPLLGKLTVREMLFFTLYHDRHHLEIVRRWRGEGSSGEE